MSSLDFGASRRGRAVRLVTVSARALLLAGLALSAAHCDKSEAHAAAQEAPATARAPLESCGEKGRPDCPTQAWMKATLQPLIVSGDTARLEGALTKLAAAAPAGYDDWAAISEAGANAAKSGDMPGVKASCGNCHAKHRARFRAELRQKSIL